MSGGRVRACHRPAIWLVSTASGESFREADTLDMLASGAGSPDVRPVRPGYMYQRGERAKERKSEKGSKSEGVKEGIDGRRKDCRLGFDKRKAGSRKEWRSLRLRASDMAIPPAARDMQRAGAQEEWSREQEPAVSWSCPMLRGRRLGDSEVQPVAQLELMER